YVRRCCRNWNGIAGNWSAVRSIDIRAGKIATQVGIRGLHAVNDPAHVVGGNADELGRGFLQTQTFIAGEKERFIVPVVEPWDSKRPANKSAKIIQDQLRFGTGKRIPGIHGGILVILKDAAMEVVRSTLGDRRNVADPAELGIV